MSAVAELAPALVVRAACWPLADLTAFADPGLARLAGEAEADAAYVAAYEASLGRQRAQLWAATAGSARFLRALAFANPDFAERAARLLPEAPRNKRRRHAETTLYRYLARACARTEPCGLWSGVALARWAKGTRVTPAPARHLLAPDLRPFQALLRSLARSPEHARAGLWKLNPTARRSADGGHAYWARVEGGRVVRRRARGGPAVDGLVAALGGLPPLPYAALCEALREPLGADAGELDAALGALIGGGMVVGGLDLPARFECPWQALSLAARDLAPPARAAWWRAYRALRKLAARLGRGLEACGVDEVVGAQREGALVVARLADELGQPRPETPAAFWRCDFGLPFAIELGDDLRDRVEASLDQYAAFQATYGLGAALREWLNGEALFGDRERVALADVEAAPKAGPARSWEDFVASVVGAALPPRLGRALSSWRSLLGADARQVVAAVGNHEAGPPWGGLLFGLAGPRLVVHGVVDDVAPLYARFCPLWAERGEPPGGPLHRWYRDQLAETARRAGLIVAEYVAPYEENPNVLARPALTAHAVSLWHALPDEVGLRGALLRRSGGAAFVALPHGGRAAAFSFSSALSGSGDPVGQALLATSFRAARLPPFRADDVPFRDEICEARPSPEVLLEGGAVARTRRTLLGGEALRSLAEAAPALRFARWQRLARAHGWGPTLFVRRGGEPALPVPRDSPLALEAAFEGAAGRAQPIFVEEPAEQTFLAHPNGQRFVTQFAAPFVRRQHLWQAPAAAPEGPPRAHLAAMERGA